MQGALGHGDTRNRSTVSRVDAIALLPVAFVAAGNNHSMALGVSGAALLYEMYFNINTHTPPC